MVPAAADFGLTYSSGVYQQERIVIVMCIFAVATYLASMLTNILQCLPIERAWQIKPYPGG